MLPIIKIASVFALSILSIVFLKDSAQATSIQSLPNLQSVTFLERTGTVDEGDIKTFSYNSTELTTRLADPMTDIYMHPANYDFYGARLYNPYSLSDVNYSELYDVFYSDASGNFNANGEYITVEAVWARYQGLTPALGVNVIDPATGVVGGGLNIAAVYLTFADTSKLYADVTSSYVAFGDNKVEGSYGRATDGDLATATTMGNTIQPGHPDRLRITVGFSSPAAVPLPATLLLLAPGLLAIWRFRGRFRN
jgi:hypothetical protein